MVSYVANHFNNVADYKVLILVVMEDGLVLIYMATVIVNNES